MPQPTEVWVQEAVDSMLSRVERSSYSLDVQTSGLIVALAGRKITFNAASPVPYLSFEELVSALEARMSFERLGLMLKAAGADPTQVPLWAVSGSSVLAQWLAWSGTGKALRRSFELSDAVGHAPVTGGIDRRARRELGQGRAVIRVRQGRAIAEQIELSELPRAVAALGGVARIRVEKQKLPESTIDRLMGPDLAERRKVAAVLGHPFTSSTDLELLNVKNEAASVVLDIVTHWVPLEPIPASCWSVLPAEADPVFPWAATKAEIAELDVWIERARQHCRASNASQHGALLSGDRR